MNCCIIALESDDPQLDTQNIRNVSLSITTVKNKQLSLLMLFINIMNQIEEIVQPGNFKKLLMKSCKSLMASKINGIFFFSKTCINILNKYDKAILLMRHLSFLFSWTNYSILRELLSFNSKAVGLLDEFKSLLYPLSTIVFYPIPIFSIDMIPCKASEFTLLGIRCDKSLWKCSLCYVFSIESLIIRNCEITKHCLHLLAVKSNPTIFYWTIPKCVVELIKTKVATCSELLYSKGILEVLLYPKQSVVTGDDIIIGSLGFIDDKENIIDETEVHNINNARISGIFHDNLYYCVLLYSM